MYATKQAIMAIEHERDTEVHVFMMDMRAFSKGYEAYHRRAIEKYGIEFTRCRISALKENPANGNLIVRYVDESANQRISEAANQRINESANLDSPFAHSSFAHSPFAHSSFAHSSFAHSSFAHSPMHLFADSPIRQEEFDLVVLSVGMEMSEGVLDLGRRLGIELDDYGFCHTVQFDPLQTSKPGIYAVGPFREPKDIPESVIEASGAAAAAGALLVQARGTLVRLPEYPP